MEIRTVKAFKIFDILFISTEEFYKKFKDSDARTMGWLLVSLVQYLILLDLAVLFAYISGRALSSIITTTMMLPVMCIIGGFNFYRYSNEEKCCLIQEEWNNKSTKKKRTFNLIMIFTIILLMGIPIAYGIINHR